MTPEALYARLRLTQGSRGYHFNPDHQWVLEVLAGVLTNEQRYGYGSCPGRLATGDLELDRPIICPCAFRDEDIATYDSCYCRLYLSQEAAAGRRPRPEIIPERWLG